MFMHWKMGTKQKRSKNIANANLIIWPRSQWTNIVITHSDSTSIDTDQIATANMLGAYACCTITTRGKKRMWPNAFRIMRLIIQIFVIASMRCLLFRFCVQLIYDLFEKQKRQRWLYYDHKLWMLLKNRMLLMMYKDISSKCADHSHRLLGKHSPNGAS